MFNGPHHTAPARTPAAPPARSPEPPIAPTEIASAALDLDGLTVPRTEGLAMERALAASTQQSPSAVEHITPNASQSASFTSKLRATLMSPGVWSGAGAAAISIGVSNAALVGHTLLVLWTARNEIRTETGRSKDNGTNEPKPGFPGYKGLAYDALNSPGFYRIATGLSYLIGSIEAFSYGKNFESFVFGAAVLSCIASLPVLNHHYQGTRTTTTAAERGFRAVWNKLPLRAQNFFKDNGLFMSLSNGALALGTLNLAELAHQPVVGALTAAGIGVLGFGLCKSIYGLVLGREMKGSPASTVFLNAIANGTLSVASFVSGSPLVGIAKGCWLVACGLFGQRILAASGKDTSTND